MMHVETFYVDKFYGLIRLNENLLIKYEILEEIFYNINS